MDWRIWIILVGAGHRGCPWLSGAWPLGWLGWVPSGPGVWGHHKAGGWVCGLNQLLKKGLTDIWWRPQNWVKIAQTKSYYYWKLYWFTHSTSICLVALGIHSLGIWCIEMNKPMFSAFVKCRQLIITQIYSFVF